MDLKDRNVIFEHENNCYTPTRDNHDKKIERNALTKAIDNRNYYKGVQLCG